MKRITAFACGLLIALSLAVLAQEGGFPSRPRFLSVGIGTQAPATNGDLKLTGTLTANSITGNLTGNVTGNVTGNAGTASFLNGGPSLGTNVWYSDSIGQRFFFDASTYIKTPTAFPVVFRGSDDVDRITINPTTGSVDVSNSLTVAGHAVCLSTGTNCPTPGALPTIVIKSTTTSRASTISPTADPELTFTPASGTYHLQGCLYFSASTDGSMGARIQFNRTSSGSNTFAWHGAYTPTGGGTQFAASGAGSPGGTNSRVTLTSVSVAPNNEILCFQGTLKASGPPVGYAIEWSQNSSNANNLNMLLGSYILYTRVGA